jgi:RNA polymerase sigma-70 factor (ECF subfamily)
MGGRQSGFFDEAASSATVVSDIIRSASDGDLMVGLGRGETACLAELLRRHRNAVVGFAAALVDPDTAEDVAQETFLRVSAHASRWRPLGPVRAYLLHIARNVALNERRRQRNRFSLLGAARSALNGRSVPTPGELLDESELRAAILRALDAMPVRRREVFALVRFGGLSYREAATVMGTSEQTAANQMSRAMADVRRAIDAFSDESS